MASMVIETESISDIAEALMYVKKVSGEGYGGWRVELLSEKVLSKSEERLLLCVDCRGLLREASVLEREGRQELLCSACLPHGDTHSVQTAQVNREVINEKQVNCPLEECKWTDGIDRLRHHLEEECPLLPIPCPLRCPPPEEEMGWVTNRVERRLMETHEREVCPMRLIRCEFCEREVKACQTNAHLEECEDFLIPCPNACAEGDETKQVKRRDLAVHLSEECPLQRVSCKECEAEFERFLVEEHERDLCPMRILDCDFCEGGIKANEMDFHLEECEEFVIACPNACNGEDGVWQFKRKHLTSHLGEECPLQEVECLYSEFGCEVKLERRLVEQHEKSYAHIHMKLSMEGMKSIQKLQSDKIEALERANKEKEIEILLLKEEFDEFKSNLIPPKAGSIKWRVQVRSIKEIIDNDENAYSSKPFYVVFYKFQVSISRTDSHLGCYLSIMNGNWDCALSWPLRCKYTFTLYSHHMHYYDVVESGAIGEEDLTHNYRCFQKPQGGPNAGFGCNRFILISDLSSGYIQENAITLEASVEIIPTSKSP